MLDSFGGVLDCLFQLFVVSVTFVQHAQHFAGLLLGITAFVERARNVFAGFEAGYAVADFVYDVSEFGV